MSKSRAEIQRELEELEYREFQQLQALKKHKEENLIYYFTRPNPKQAELIKGWLNNKKKVFTFTGGNRLGKTTIGTVLSISTMFGEFPWSKEDLSFLFPHKKARKVRYIGQDWEKHIQQVVIPAFRKWWPKDRPIHTKKNQTGADYLWTDEKTGSTLEILSNSQESRLHEGWDGDLVVYDEPPSRDIRVANARGLVDRCGRELFVMTLLGEAYIDREIINARNSDGTPDLSVFNVKGEIYDNVGFGITLEGVEQFAKTLTEEEKEARLFGKPAYLSGLVYPQFNRDTHLVERFRIPPHWIVDIAIDIHPREKQAVLFLATSPEDKKFIFHEIWEHGDGTFVGRAILEYVQKHKLLINRIIIDPFSKGDKNNIETVFDKVNLVLMTGGFCLQVASKDKAAGILSIKEFLLSKNNIPSLFFFDDLRRAIYEIEGYMWDKETQKPVDKDDHMMENLYRLLLLETSYSNIHTEDEESSEFYKRNSMTGY